MTSHPLPPPPYYDLPAYDDAVIGNRLQQVESRLQKYIADVLKHNDVAVSEKAKQMVSNILLIYEKRFDDLGGEVRQKMDAFKDWASRLGTGEQTLIEMDKKLAKIHDKVAELDAFHAVIKRHEDREKKIHSDLLRRIKALEEREEKNHDVLIDEGVMRHIEKMVEARMRGRGADAAVDIDIDALFDDSKLTPEEIEEIETDRNKYNTEFYKYIGYLNETQGRQLIKNDFFKKSETVYLIWSGMMITDQNVYFLYGLPEPYTLNFISVYTFKKKLSYSCIKFLKYSFDKKCRPIDGIHNDRPKSSIVERVVEYFSHLGYTTDKQHGYRHRFLEPVDAVEKFEQIIRLIPGSFQNGDWVALGGFFGMYFNKKTLEISEGPPPMPI
jgi:hypothetical protein